MSQTKRTKVEDHIIILRNVNLKTYAIFIIYKYTIIIF